MTPKEKRDELLTKIYDIIDDACGRTVDYEIKKKAALQTISVLCDEVVSCVSRNIYSEFNLGDMSRFYANVKNEVELIIK